MKKSLSILFVFVSYIVHLCGQIQADQERAKQSVWSLSQLAKSERNFASFSLSNHGIIEKNVTLLINGYLYDDGNFMLAMALISQTPIQPEKYIDKKSYFDFIFFSTGETVPIFFNTKENLVQGVVTWLSSPITNPAAFRGLLHEEFFGVYYQDHKKEAESNIFCNIMLKKILLESIQKLQELMGLEGDPENLLLNFLDEREQQLMNEE